MNGNVHLNTNPQQVLNTFFEHKSAKSCSLSDKKELKLEKGTLICADRGLFKRIIPVFSAKTICNLPAIVDYCIEQGVAHEKLLKKIEKFNSKSSTKQYITDDKYTQLVGILSKEWKKQALSAAYTNDSDTLENLEGKYRVPEDLLLNVCKKSVDLSRKTLEKITTEGSVDAVDEEGLPVLFHAINNNHFEAVRFLIENGAKVDWQNDQGQNLMHFVQDVRIAQELHESNQLLVQQLDINGHSAVYQALAYNYSSVAIYLLGVYEAASAYRNENNQNFMHMVQDVRVAEKLHAIDQSLIHEADSSGKKPAYTALLNKNEEMFEWIVNTVGKGVLFEEIDTRSKTLLMYIVEHCSADFAKKMVDLAIEEDKHKVQHARLKVPSVEGFGPIPGFTLMHYALCGASKEVILNLVQLGVPIDESGAKEGLDIMVPFERLIKKIQKEAADGSSIAPTRLQMVDFLVHELQVNHNVVNTLSEELVDQIQQFISTDEAVRVEEAPIAVMT